MEKIKSSLFWDLRSIAYDLAMGYISFIPYNELLKDVVKELDLKDNDILLEAGCGTGDLLKYIIERKGKKIKIYAVDISKIMLIKANKKIEKIKEKEVYFKQLNLDNKLDFPDQFFDKIVSINVIYALKDPNHFLKECKRILKSKGKLVIATPKESFKGSEIMKYFFAKASFIEKVKGILFFPISLLLVLPFEIVIAFRERRGPYHKFKKIDLVNLCKNNGFKNVKIFSSFANQDYVISTFKP